jgi:hypothetical protein
MLVAAAAVTIALKLRVAMEVEARVVLAHKPLLQVQLILVAAVAATVRMVEDS